MSPILHDARSYEKMRELQISKEPRPAFHLSARTGWMNDPNGFSYYKELYHLFYQYHPYSSHWGPMHWGHAVSKDLLHWEYLPIALAPDKAYDKAGCFSGSALCMEDGRHLLMYTGVTKEISKEGGEEILQTQCIAIGDGMDYEKYAQNPVLDKKNLPPKASGMDFRDPRIWQEEDGSFLCLVGSCDLEKDGQILLYKSRNGLDWDFEKVLIKNKGRFGKMWECPDFFALDGKQVLLVSPQDMLPEDLEYHNGNGTVCIIGSYDKESHTFSEEKNQAIDYGIDFYAPQTVLAPDGRRIMIGWMQNWDTCNLYSPEHPWFGQMSLPRELSVREGRLLQKPVRELEDHRRGRVSYENVLVGDLMSLEGVCGRRIDMELVIRPCHADRLYHKFSLRFAQNDSYYTAVSFRPYESILKIDRKFSGSRRAVIHQRRCSVRDEQGAKGHLKLRIILDNYSAEIFINDGEQVMSATLYTDLSAKGIQFFADEGLVMDLVKYDLVF